MSTVFHSAALRRFTGPGSLRWLPVAAGLLVLYVPTYITLANGAWNEEQNEHGPLILVVIFWLLWRLREQIAALPEKGAPVAGGLLMAAGLSVYVIGRALEFVYLDAFSQIPVVAGLILVIFGWRGLRTLWFPLLFMMFLVPLPGVIVDAATGALKHLVSVVAESLLYHAGYPIARTGVILKIGQYQMLVADACSGMNSIYSLTALGMLFLYITHNGWIKTLLILGSIWPIAFVANIVRVITLVLITYHVGDEAGQGFMHDFSGMVLFAVALGMLIGLHAVLEFAERSMPRYLGGAR